MAAMLHPYTHPKHFGFLGVLVVGEEDKLLDGVHLHAAWRW